MNEKPSYVVVDGDIAFPPPFLQTNANLNAWLLRADSAKLQAICDEMFNSPSGGAVDYRPLTSSVLMTLVPIERVSSLDTTASTQGYTTETDVCFWFLAGAFENNYPKRLVFVLPYIWVTDPITMVTGREVYGFRKAFAWTQVPASPTDPGPFWVETPVIRQYSVNSPMTRERILELTRDGQPNEGENPTFEALLDKLTSAIPWVDDRGKAMWQELWADAAFKPEIPIVFLKQFHDAENPGKACYQAIIEANAAPSSTPHDGWLTGSWKLTTQEYDSLRFASRLGLETSPITPLLSLRVSFSFIMNMGKEIWRAQ